MGERAVTTVVLTHPSVIARRKSRLPVATVYIVDDDEGVRNALGFLSATLKVPVESYASAEALLDAHPDDLCGCVILDVNLPGMDGIALCERLAERQAELPIILISGQARARPRERAGQAKAFAYIEKPIDESILSVIRQALAKSAEGVGTDTGLASRHGRR